LSISCLTLRALARSSLEGWTILLLKNEEGKIMAMAGWSFDSPLSRLTGVPEWGRLASVGVKSEYAKNHGLSKQITKFYGYMMKWLEDNGFKRA